MIVLKKIEFNFKRKTFLISAKKLSSLGMIRGLMFRSSSCNSLLFSFSIDKEMSIHSFFVFFPFLAIWLDRRNNVIDYEIVKPFTALVKSPKKFRKLVEIPLNNENKKIIKFIVGEERFK